MSDAEQSVSVVIPCYNRESSVEKAIHSVLSQDYPDFEVIAVDDRSTDATLEVLRSIEDPRLQVIVNEGPKGAAGARNAGAKLAKSSWVAFQDSDDLWYPSKLSKQVEKVKDSDFVAVYCAMDCFEDGVQILRVPNDITSHLEGDLVSSLLSDSFISTQTVMIRRDVFEKIGGMDPEFRSLDDWEMMIRVSLEGPIAFLDEVLVEQHMSSNSITRSSENRVNAQIQLLGKHSELWSAYPKELARHHYRVSGGLLANKRYREASSHAKEAAKLQPFNWRYVSKAIASSIFAKLRKEAR
ncbi:glycosyltransferase [Roseibium sp. MMSF_3412]|uniref:glycosyltransferase family 2 protein n=1 Tax=Roseibium sp. MMSF_3412 TaxID=3046712 RepID=UPI00273D2E47|nr:glycosyltransferase [Roseibium sp. MMSF_3412]